MYEHLTRSCKVGPAQSGSRPAYRKARVQGARSASAPPCSRRARRPNSGGGQWCGDKECAYGAWRRAPGPHRGPTPASHRCVRSQSRASRRLQSLSENHSRRQTASVSPVLRRPSRRPPAAAAAREGAAAAVRPVARYPMPIATWLILPVVICLSQRLSHACLSTDFNIVKPRMAH